MARPPLHRVMAIALWVVAWIGGVIAVGLDRVIPPVLTVIPGWGTVGMLLAFRRPSNPIGWVLLGTALVPALAGFVAVPIETQTALLATGVALVLILFPTGAPPGRFWWVAVAVVASSALAGAAVVDLGGFELPVAVITGGIGLAWCVAAPVVRTRRASAQERAQVRWMGFVAAWAGVCVVIAALGVVTEQRVLLGLAGLLVVLILLVGLPGAILVAVLRFRLYEIDRLLSRSVTFAIVAGLMAAVFAVPTTLLPRLLGGGNQAVTVGSTLVAVAVFTPLRDRVNRAVDRRFNPAAAGRAKSSGPEEGPVRR